MAKKKHLPVLTHLSPARPARGADGRYAAYMAERSSTNWENYIGALRAAGRLVEIDGVSIDGESMFRRRFRCDTRICSPGRSPATGKPWRERGDRSCCADLTVDLAPSEVRGLESRWPEIRAWLASRDRYFSDEAMQAKDCLEISTDFELSLRKRGGRCIFALRDPEWGIRCGIHSAAMSLGIEVREVKPIVCDTFPLLVIDIAPGRFYLGAHDADVDGLASLGDSGPAAFPCLADEKTGPRMFEEMAPTIRAYFGDDFFARLEREAEAYLARPKPTKMAVP